jgi:hypothetical protein
LLFDGLKLLRRDAGRFCDQRPLHTCGQEAVDRLESLPPVVLPVVPPVVPPVVLPVVPPVVPPVVLPA